VRPTTRRKKRTIFFRESDGACVRPDEARLVIERLPRVADV